MSDGSYSVQQLEDALKELCEDHPEYIFTPIWHSTGSYNDKGEPLYLVNIGTIGSPVYIGGTKDQLVKRINEFNKLVIKMFGPSEEVKTACRAYIDSIKGEAWYNPDLDDIILDSYWEGILWYKYVYPNNNNNDESNKDENHTANV